VLDENVTDDKSPTPSAFVEKLTAALKK